MTRIAILFVLIGMIFITGTVITLNVNRTFNDNGGTVSKQHDFGELVNLPVELHFLIEPALKYGKHQLPSEVREFVATMSVEDRKELEMLATKITLIRPGDKINEFLDMYRMTEYPESANLYFLIEMVDFAVGIKSTAGKPTIEEDIRQHITSMSQHGSYRLASRRMWAARALGDLGPQAVLAIPSLETALNDDDLRVKIWAHAALACIKGERESHLRTLRQLFAKYSSLSDDEAKSLTIDAEDAIEKMERDGLP